MAQTVDPQTLAAKARTSRVGVLVCGYRASANRAVIALARETPGLPIALGLHPWYADDDVDEVINQILRSRPCCIGEIGLDAVCPGRCPSMDRQMSVFRQMLELAFKLDVPVSMHCRKWFEPLAAALKDFPSVRGVLHGFSGSWEQARQFVRQGLYIGLGGVVARASSRRAKRLAAELPLDRLLVETDLPFSALGPVPAQQVAPWHVKYVIDAIADVRGVSAEVVEDAADRNARNLMGVDESFRFAGGRRR